MNMRDYTYHHIPNIISSTSVGYLYYNTNYFEPFFTFWIFFLMS